ncbi:formate dehydrogenase subunit alpha [Actinopolymorpha sp. B17G11]|uniref:formate dehydrogenase subunit alpha n=1 Tax=Actinopolymorpha sp. B17G11 TaxID=3160861 RepID=UPI0032E4B856
MRVRVNGTPVEVPDGSSVLAAVRAAGLEVPTLCHDERLSPSGSCRVCLVRSGPAVVAACTTPAAEGADIRTDDETVAATVRRVVELTVERLPAGALDLPTELAAVCDQLGVGPEAFDGAGQGPGRGLGRDDSHPYVRLDAALCIACGRCVRMCDEVQGTFALTLVGRGADTVVAPGTGGPWVESACVACGGCVDSCPSGAISGPVPLPVAVAPTATVTRTTCGYCGVGCALDVHTRTADSNPDPIPDPVADPIPDPMGDTDEPAIVAITPAHDGPVNRGHACVKGRFAYDFVRSPDRLTTPLVRRAGRLEPATWDDALALVGRELTRIRETHGPDSIAAISSARSTNEENYLLQKLMRTVIGTNNVDNCSRICHAPSAAGLTATFGLAGGTNAADDLDDADCILLVGANPTEAHPVIGARIMQRALNGARLVVIDPRRTGLARVADVHLQGRPGSNVAVFHGLARLLLDNGWVDEAFLATRADGWDELRALLHEYPPEQVAELSGIEPAILAEAARLFGTARKPSIVYGLGVTEHAHGTDGVRTLANLAVLRGAVGTPNGGGVNPLRGQNNVQGASDMGALPDLLPGYQKVTDDAVRRRFGEEWGTPVPPRPGLRIPEMFDAALTGQVRALYVFGEDILQTDPDSGHVRAAVEAAEFVVSQEIFPSATALAADVVLPGASFLEKDGTFVNFDRRFQRVRPALDPPGLARTDFAVVTAVARALGGDLGCPTPADALAECARLTPVFAGISHDRLDNEYALHWPCRGPDDPGEARLYEQEFATPNGRAQLAALPWAPPGESPDTAYPYTLITGRRLVHYNSGTMTRRTPNLALVPDEHLEINPDDALRLGLREGDLVEIASRRGSITAPGRLTDDVAPGEVFLSFAFPDVAANLLTSGETDEVTSCPEYKVTAVRLRKG